MQNIPNVFVERPGVTSIISAQYLKDFNDKFEEKRRQAIFNNQKPAFTAINLVTER